MKRLLTVIMLTFVLTSSLSAQDDDTPLFRLFDGKLSVRAGGAVKATASFDWNDPIDDPDCFAVSSIPMNPSPGNGGKFQISARQSYLQLDLRWLEGAKDEARVFVYGIFLGENYGFVLEEAFASYRGFRAGYGYGIYYDAGAVFPTIDYQGPNSYFAPLCGFADYTHHFRSGWSVGAGIDMPIESITTGKYTESVSARIPDIPFYVQYAWGDGESSHIRASGILRTLVYRDLATNRNRNVEGWGIKLSGTAEVCPRLRTFFEATYGKGVASYFQDLWDLGLDLVPDGKTPGKMSAPSAWGGFAGLSFSITDRLTASGGGSILRTYPDRYDDGSRGDLYRTGIYATGNLIYNISSHLQCGVEYNYGIRENVSGLKRHDNRIQTMLQFSF